MKKSKELPEWDDGRTIVNMDVEGMPWNNRPSYLRNAVKSLKEHRERSKEGGEEMSRKEARFFTWGAIKAGLLIVGIFSVAIVLFILLCQLVWFKS